MSDPAVEVASESSGTRTMPSPAGLARGGVALLLALLLVPGAFVSGPAQAQVPCCMIFEDLFEDKLDEEAEGTVEENIEDNIEQEVEANIEDDLQDTVEEVVEASVEAQVEADVETAVENTVEIAVEDSVEASVEDDVEDSVELAVEESVEEAVAEGVEAGLESELEAAVEETVEVAVETSVEASVEEDVEASVEASVEGALERDVESEIAESIEDRLESEIDEILDEIENKFEVDEERIQTAQWLVMAEPEAFEELAREGYLFDRVTELPGMGLRLAEVAAPSSFNISDVRKGVIDVVGSGRADVDINHLYTAGSPISHQVQGVPPRNAVLFPADIDQMTLRIGMIDSLVDTGHPALAGSRIRTASFVRAGSQQPTFHGTAIASIIAANSSEYRGLAPHAELYAAGVFEQDGKRGEVASTVSLVRALDWLVSAGVDVVNVSLAGPPNRLLETALNRAAERGVMVLAAAGNGGPVAKPMYPAAYDTVVAVTAVDTSGRVFRLANRGDYLDIAAPGVGMLHARAGGGYATSSGTSFAVPFATTAAARLRQLQPGLNVLDSLYRSAEDLGPPGRDDIYGYGLLRPLPLVTSGR